MRYLEGIFCLRDVKVLYAIWSKVTIFLKEEKGGQQSGQVEKGKDLAAANCRVWRDVCVPWEPAMR